MTTIETHTHTQKEIKMSSKATKKKQYKLDTKREGERMRKERNKGRKKGQNNLTYLILLEMQDTPSPLSSTSLNEASPS
jgi:hypothetical protein